MAERNLKCHVFEEFDQDCGVWLRTTQIFAELDYLWQSREEISGW